MREEKEIRAWRCFGTRGQPGLHVWFDPRTELLTLRDLTEDEKSVTLDKLSSVSAVGLAGLAEELDGCEQGLESSSRDPSFVQLDLMKEVDDG